MKTSMFFLILFFVHQILFAQNAEELKTKIDQLNKVYSKAMIENDVKTMMSLYTEDIVSMPSYQPMIRGLETLRELSEQATNSEWKTTKFDLTTKDIIPAGNLVIEIGNYQMNMTGPGVPEWSDKGKYITVWKIMDNGDLKMRIEMWNTDNNPWMEQQNSNE